MLQSNDNQKLNNSAMITKRRSVTLWILFSLNVYTVYFYLTNDQTKISEINDRSFDIENNNSTSRKVLFYVYDFPETNWYNQCLPEYPWIDIKNGPNFGDQKIPTSSFSNDIILAQSLENHPWRTDDPKQAEVFILPLLLEFFLSKNPKCNGLNFDQMLDKTTNFLLHDQKNSEFFSYYAEKMNKPHFILATGDLKLQQIFVDEQHKKFRDQIAPKLIVGVQSRSQNFYNWRSQIIVPPVESIFLPLEDLDKITALENFNNDLQVSEEPEKLDIHRYGIYENQTEALKKDTLGLMMSQQNSYAYTQWKSRYIDFYYLEKVEEESNGSHIFNQLTELVFDSLPETTDKVRNIIDGIKWDISKTLKDRKILEKDQFNLYLNLARGPDNVKYIVGIQPENEINNNNGQNAQIIYPLCNWNDCVFKETCTKCMMTEDLLKITHKWIMKSKFALIIYHDNILPSKLYDAIANGQIPIIISTDRHMRFQDFPFTHKINWRDLVFTITGLNCQWHEQSENEQEDMGLGDSVDNEMDREVCVQDISSKFVRLLISGEDVFKEKLRALHQARRDLSWLHSESRIVENIVTSVASLER